MSINNEKKGLKRPFEERSLLIHNNKKQIQETSAFKAPAQPRPVRVPTPIPPFQPRCYQIAREVTIERVANPFWSPPSLSQGNL